MPGKVKVKIISGKNLPVMDRSSDTTDAYVEIKLGNTTYKTDVCRRTLHPQWNTDWYRFEVDDSELQDEPLQIRLMDHDTYSANDAIGKVYLNLNPLLLPVAGQLEIGDNNPHHEISGWIPVYDTMHGIRGEVNVTVKVELFSDFNRFRQSSCGVHFFYSPVIPQGYHAKVINGFVEELIVDDDPEYQWIDKIRTPRASNEARQTLFFKLSGELQRRIGVKALGVGGNAVIGYRQCFDIEGESGIVARGIGTAVTLIKAYNTANVVVEAKEENVENYLKFVGDGKSFSLCSTSPPHKIHLSLFDPFSNSNNSQSGTSHVTKRHYVCEHSNKLSPSVSNPNLYQGHNIKDLLDQEEKRGKSVMSRRFKKFKHSQKSLSKKMIALKAKLNDSIGEETDVIQSRNINKRKLFKRTSSDSSAMAEILARSVMRATTSLSCILEDQPHLPNDDDGIEKAKPTPNFLDRSESEVSGFVETQSDVQSCSSSDSSSYCSYYEYKDYNNANNDVETLSNIITNVEKLQRCLSRDGLHKQYSLPAIPTRGFSLSSLDNFPERLHRENSINRSINSVFSVTSNVSKFERSDSNFEQERRSSDAYDSRLTEAKLCEELDLPELSVQELGDSTRRCLKDLTQILNERNCALTPFIKEQDQPNIPSDAECKLSNTIKNDHGIDRKQEEWKFPSGEAFQQHYVEQSNSQSNEPEVNLLYTTTPIDIAQTSTEGKISDSSRTSTESEFKFPCIKDDKSKYYFASGKFNTLGKHNESDSKGIVKTALQTMLIERADISGTDSLNTTNEALSEASDPGKVNDENSHHPVGKEKDSKGIVKTALQTMLIERADILGAPEVTEQLGPEKCAHVKTSGHDKDINPKGIVNAALEAMLIERANIVSSTSDNNTPQIGEADGSEKLGVLEDGNVEHGKCIERSDDISTIAEVNLKSINIQPKKIVKTAVQTMLLDKFNILGTYTPPTSPNLVSDEPNTSRGRSFTFNMGEYVPKSIPKTFSSVSLGDHQKSKETVLGMPFVSLSSLKAEQDYDKSADHHTTVLYQNGPLRKSVSEKLPRHKNMFRFLSWKTGEHGQNSKMFHRFRTRSKPSSLDDYKSDVRHQNRLSHIFHSSHNEVHMNDKETQTSNEVLVCQKPTQPSDFTLSSNTQHLSLTDVLNPPLKPPSSVDLASGDFIAHSKTKSACITSHHSPPAQERQDQTGGDKKEHTSDAVAGTSESPVKVNYMVPLHRRSSDSDLSITPKGNSLTGSDKSMGNAAAFFMRNNYIRRGQVNQEHFDLLEYPFLTMTKFPPRFIIQIGGSISARSVKLLERILNVDEPESRDIWWSEIRMEIRSHARSLNCNAVLGYTELTTICDDVCVLSACGTAAVIDFNSSAGDEDNFSSVQLIHKNVERDKQEV
ncbi:hypothetical protein HUJ04_012388 [Dendroctonus ponderosae]|nr:hypothetical protein HUJ04_012388 [Dendroctonus ponderosae]